MGLHNSIGYSLEMTPIVVNSLDDPRLDVFRDLRNTNSTRWHKVFVAEGTTLVERVLHSEYRVHSVMVSQQKFANFAARIPDGTTVYVVSRDLASELVGYKFHLGVVAAAVRQPSPNLNDVIPTHGPGLVIFGDHIIDQQNVGMLIRIGSAFGATAIVLSRGSADAFSRRVLRVSTGNGLYLPIVEGVDAKTAIEQLSANGFQNCATVLDDNAVELSHFNFQDRTSLVFGNETHGISASVAAKCTNRLTIRMLNGTDSVNVAVTAGIFSHAYRSQYP